MSTGRINKEADLTLLSFREQASNFLPLSHISGPQPIQHLTKFPVNVS